MRRRLCLGILLGLGLTAGGGVVTGCSSGSGAHETETGTLSLPLATHGPSGTEYRLRDAVFQIRSEYDYYSDSAAGSGDEGGHSYTVSSEDDPTASSLSLSVESGYYYVRLLPGWRMEKVGGGDIPDTDVEAQLLSSSTQWVWVGARSTSWVEFQFGLGDRALWFNGDLNINIQVYEDPDQYYGNYGGSPIGGSGTGGSAGEAPQPQGEGGV